MISHEEARKELHNIADDYDSRISDWLLNDYITQQENKDKLLELKNKLINELEYIDRIESEFVRNQINKLKKQIKELEEGLNT